MAWLAFGGIACVDAKLELIPRLFGNQALCIKMLVKIMKHSLAIDVCLRI